MDYEGIEKREQLIFLLLLPFQALPGIVFFKWLFIFFS